MKPVRLYYFSGTGNTRLVVRFVEAALKARGVDARVTRMEDVLSGSSPVSLEADTCLGVAYPVHGFGPPRIVFDFLRRLPPGDRRPAFILMTAAEAIALNRAATMRVRRRLTAKGFDVRQERLAAMPPNLFRPYPAGLAKQLCNRAGEVAGVLAGQVVEETESLYRESAALQVMAAAINMFEHSGAPWFGKDLVASAACTMCGKCVAECPARNIQAVNGRIRFGWRCLTCFRCIYGCPQKAILPRLERFAVLKAGYDIDRINSDPSIAADLVTPETQGPYRRYVRYLFEE